MKPRRIYITSAALMSLLVLSGCIKMTVTQTIENSGKSHVEVVYDATEMMQSLEGFSDTQEVLDAETAGTEDATTTEDPADDVDTYLVSDEDSQKSCDDFYAQTTWENPSCTFEGYVFSMSGDVTLTAPAFEASSGVGGTTYRYDLKNVYDVLSAVSSSQGQDFSDESLKEQKDYVEMTGIELTYTLTMPGTITTTDVGTIQEDGKTVVIDLFELPDYETAFIESKESGTPWLWIGIGALVVVLGVGGFMVMKKKKGGRVETAPAQMDALK